MEPEDIHHGVWFMLHTIALDATDPASKRAYARTFRKTCKRMGCDCETHCKEMLEKYPPEDYFSKHDTKGRDVGCFYHSFLCHNEVNERLGHRVISYGEAWRLYHKDETSLSATCKSPEQSQATRLANKYPNIMRRTSYHRR